MSSSDAIQKFQRLADEYLNLRRLMDKAREQSRSFRPEVVARVMAGYEDKSRALLAELAPLESEIRKEVAQLEASHAESATRHAEVEIRREEIELRALIGEITEEEKDQLLAGVLQEQATLAERGEAQQSALNHLKEMLASLPGAAPVYVPPAPAAPVYVAPAPVSPPPAPAPPAAPAYVPPAPAYVAPAPAPAYVAPAPAPAYVAPAPAPAYVAPAPVTPPPARAPEPVRPPEPARAAPPREEPRSADRTFTREETRPVERTVNPPDPRGERTVPLAEPPRAAVVPPRVDPPPSFDPPPVFGGEPEFGMGRESEEGEFRGLGDFGGNLAQEQDLGDLGQSDGGGGFMEPFGLLDEFPLGEPPADLPELGNPRGSGGMDDFNDLGGDWRSDLSDDFAGGGQDGVQRSAFEDSYAPAPAAGRSARGYLIRGEATPQEEYFDVTDEVLSLGRGRDNRIQIKDDTKVSRYHCRIFREGDGFWVEDNNSSNGTLVNGELITRRKLEGGEELTIGETNFRFIIR